MGNLSELFSRRPKDGIYHYHDAPWATTGEIWFVNSGAGGAGTSTAYGRHPEAPFSTVAAAWDSGLLASGDTILVAAGHTETISAAAGWDCDTAGVYVRGLGVGDLRPTITLSTANTADIDIDAASITFDNLRFVANFLDVAAAIDVNARAFTMRNCECLDTSTTLNAKIWVLGDATTTTASEMVVENCEFKAYGTANTSCVSMPGTPNRCKINDNVFNGDWGSAAILAAGAVTRIAVLRNFIQNLDAGNNVCINLAASSTGIIAYNSVGAGETDDTTDQVDCGSGCVLVANYAMDFGTGGSGGDVHGVLDPVAT